jgi:hypothetical protein
MTTTDPGRSTRALVGAKASSDTPDRWNLTRPPPVWNTAKTELRLLIRHIDCASERRDDIAHGHVIGTNRDKEELGYFLMPPEYNARNTSAFIDIADVDLNPLALMGSKYRYAAADVNLFTTRFSELRTKSTPIWGGLGRKTGFCLLRYFLRGPPNEPHQPRHADPQRRRASEISVVALPGGPQG